MTNKNMKNIRIISSSIKTRTALGSKIYISRQMLKVLLLGLVVLGCTKRNQQPGTHYYYREVIAPEGDKQGTILKLTVINNDSLYDKLERVTFLYDDDSISIEYAQPDHMASAKLKDWEIFRDFPIAIISLPIEKGYIKGDSLFIDNALYEYPLGFSDIKWIFYYDFKGVIRNKYVAGELVEDYYYITWGDTSHYHSSAMVTFYKEP